MNERPVRGGRRLPIGRKGSESEQTLLKLIKSLIRTWIVGQWGGGIEGKISFK